jgi:hypothetical protein
MPTIEAAVDGRDARGVVPLTVPGAEGAGAAVRVPTAPTASGSPPWAIVALVVANAVPLLGVLAWGWSTFDLMLLYWFETGVIGFFMLVQLFLADGADPHRRRGVRGLLARLYAVGGVAVFYAFLWHGLGFSVVEVFGPGGVFGAAPGSLPAVPPGGHFGYFFGPQSGVLEGGLRLSALGLLVSHGLSFVGNVVLRGEDRRTPPALLVWRPYGRVVALHVTLVIGGLVVAALGHPVVGLALFVVLKTAVDLRAHLRAHRNRPAVR